MSQIRVDFAEYHASMESCFDSVCIFWKQCTSISTRAGRKHHTPKFSSTRGGIPLAEKLCIQIFGCLRSAPKCRLHRLGPISSPAFLAKAKASDAKRWFFFKWNASWTLRFARSYQRVVRSANFTLESSEVFLWRERRATVGHLAARAARRPNLLTRSGQHTRLGLLSRLVLAQSSRRHKVEHLRVQTASERHGKQRRT
jgi:hypothetical protein